jgi:hypothetical protein
MDVIVIDSVAAPVAKAEIEGERGEPHVGRQARLMSQALRKLWHNRSQRTAVIFINQLLEKVGVIHGNPETTPCGRPLKFYATVRIDLRANYGVEEKKVRIGNEVTSEVVKNRVAPPFRQAKFEVPLDHGISREGEILDLGVAVGILNRSASYYYGISWLWDKDEKPPGNTSWSMLRLPAKSNGKFKPKVFHYPGGPRKRSRASCRNRRLHEYAFQIINLMVIPLVYDMPILQLHVRMGFPHLRRCHLHSLPDGTPPPQYGLFPPGYFNSKYVWIPLNSFGIAITGDAMLIL